MRVWEVIIIIFSFIFIFGSHKNEIKYCTIENEILLMIRIVIHL